MDISSTNTWMLWSRTCKLTHILPRIWALHSLLAPDLHWNGMPRQSKMLKYPCSCSALKSLVCHCHSSCLLGSILEIYATKLKFWILAFCSLTKSIKKTRQESIPAMIFFLTSSPTTEIKGSAVNWTAEDTTSISFPGTGAKNSFIHSWCWDLMPGLHSCPYCWMLHCDHLKP